MGVIRLSLSFCLSVHVHFDRQFNAIPIRIFYLLLKCKTKSEWFFNKFMSDEQNAHDAYTHYTDTLAK